MKKYILFLGINCFHLFKVHSQNFSSSNLPIVLINTGGQYIDTAYQTFIVWMGIIDNGPGNRNYITDPPNNFNGDIEIELHGSSSLWFPKKSYKITTLNSAHQHINMPLLGMPEEEDWIFNAPYQDKTFLRDPLAFRIFNQMGHYSSRGKFFELVINGDYKGVYEMQEKIKRNQFRVDISKLKNTEISGDDLTGGYIIKLDKWLPGEEGWYSNYNSNLTNDSANYFLYHYPKADSLVQVQKDYIKNHFHHFENVLRSSYFSDPDSGYRKYIDVPSFIDFFITNEISKNVDGYRTSTFLYKDRDSKGGKLHCGPLWDFDLAWDNASYNGGHNTYGWQYQYFPYDWFVPFWWWQLMSDNSFKNELKCRYQSLRTTTLSYNSLYQYIDSMALYLDESQARNFTKWPILGQAIYPNPNPVPTSYTGEISVLKNWLWQRLVWLDSNMPGTCDVGIASNDSQQNSIHTFPNPFMNTFNINYNIDTNTNIKIELLNTLGDELQIVFEGNKSKGNYEEEVSAQQLPAGIYIVKLSLDKQVYYQKMIKL